MTILVFSGHCPETEPFCWGLVTLAERFFHGLAKMKKIEFLDTTPLYITWLQKHLGVKSRLDVMRHVGAGKGSHVTNLCCAEYEFCERGRPFFNVYPQVVEALSKTSLNIRPEDIPKSIVHSLGCICVKIPVHSWLTDEHGVNWFFIRIGQASRERVAIAGEQHKNSQTMLSVVYAANMNVLHKDSGYVNSWSIKWGETFMENHWEVPKSTARAAECAMVVARLALGCLLLAADPDFIKPVLLKADEGKTTPLEERIARAKRRGVYGFTIGEDIETCPHFRRPHFAVRWTGKGATIPKLVPVKGAVINKKLMTTVPTGFENDEQNDEC